MKSEQPKAVHSKRAAREAALRALYCIAVGKVELQDSLTPDVLGNNFTVEALEFIKRIVTGSQEGHLELDGRYSEYLTEGWDLERLAVIDKITLRMACFELWHEEDVPPKVVINEYVNLVKSYGSADSGKFVNAVLAKVLPQSPKADWSPADRTLPKKRVNKTEPEPVPDDDTAVSGKWVIKTDV